MWLKSVTFKKLNFQLFMKDQIFHSRLMKYQKRQTTIVAKRRNTIVIAVLMMKFLIPIPIRFRFRNRDIVYIYAVYEEKDGKN